MIEVRPTSENDFEQWSRMRAALWPSSAAQNHLAEIQEFFGKDTFQGWVAIDGEKYIGFAEASIRPFANGCDSRPVVFFEGVWVDEAYRRTGTGRKFVEAIESWANSNGLNEVGSDAELSNTLSHSCHQKWGFEETERVVYYRKKLS